MAQLKYIPSIIEQYVDEIPFLYIYRKNAAISPSYLLNELAEIDERLDAHVTGLLMIGSSAWELCEEELSFDRPEELFTLSLVAIKLNDQKKLEALIQELEEEEQLDAVADALVYFPFEQVKLLLTELYKNPSPKVQYIVVRAFRLHGQKSERLVQHALSSESPLVKREAILKIGTLGMSNLLSLTAPFMDDEDEGVAFAAMWTATRFGNLSALQKLESFVSHPRYGDQALQYVVMQKDVNRTTEILRALFAEEATKRLSILGLGYAGKANAITPLIALMDVPESARVAGEAFSLLTGIDVAANSLDREAPEGFEAGPTESPDDEDVELDPDEDLPWPDSQKIDVWWKHNQQNYFSDKRYIWGQELSAESLKNVLRHGNQRQRLFAANVSALYDRDHPLFNVQAKVKQQKSFLSH